MTAAVAGSSTRGGGRTVLIGLVLIGVLLTIGALSADRARSDPYDPSSLEPEGTKALHELITSFGAAVDVPDHLPLGDDADVAILFEDVLAPPRRDELRAWVAAGHTLVVADPSSELVPEADIDPNLGGFGGPAGASVVPRGSCSIAALDNVVDIDPGSEYTALYRFLDQGDRPVCFAADGMAFATLEVVGDGLIVGLASPDVFTNRQLGERDNAVLATDLLAPAPGTRVSFITRRATPDGSHGPAGDASDSLGDLIGFGVKLLLLELVVAVVVYAFARGRRLGQPILEPQPVQIAGSELVEAVGNLLQSRHDPASSGAVLRADVRRLLGDRLGVPRDAPIEVLAERAAARTRLEHDYVLAVLRDQPVASDDELISLANHIEAIRQEVLHGHAP